MLKNSLISWATAMMVFSNSLKSEEKVSNATVYLNGDVYTFDFEQPKARGFRIENGIITHVFDSNNVPKEFTGTRINLNGATVFPGLTDAHLHLEWLGESLYYLSLKQLSKKEIIEIVQKKAATLQPGEWIRGEGWDEMLWEVKQLPSKKELDEAAPRNPVWLDRADHHAVWLNSEALRLSKIEDSTQDPEGGLIIRDDNFNITGILVDNAINFARSALPLKTDKEVEEDLLRAIVVCQKAGLTGVHDMATSPRSFRILQSLDRRGLLNFRVTAYVQGNEEELVPLLDNPDNTALVHLAGVKLFLDGSLGSHAALLKKPYKDAPLNYGLQLLSTDSLLRRLKEIQRLGYQAAIHAIGDQANHLALDAIEIAQEEWKGSESPRHRIEHAQIIAPEDIERFSQLNVIASMQPIHCTSDMIWVKGRLGEERLVGAYAWASLISRNVVIPLGSDAPVEHLSPWLGIHAAITRQNIFGYPEGGFMPAEKLTLSEAIAGYTYFAAYAARMENFLGMIKPGYQADLTVVSADPFSLEPERLLNIYPYRTIVSGKEVFVEPNP